MREMTGARDDLDLCSGNFALPTLAISRGDDAVPGAPQQQRRSVDPVQPAFEGGVGHVGLPAVEREGLAAARDRRKIAARERGEINSALCRVGPGEPQVLLPRHGMHVGDVALVATAELDAEWSG